MVLKFLRVTDKLSAKGSEDMCFKVCPLRQSLKWNVIL